MFRTRYYETFRSKGHCYVWALSSGEPKESSKLLPKNKILAHEGRWLESSSPPSTQDFVRRYSLCCQFSPDSSLLVTTSADHTAKLWRTSDFTLVQVVIHLFQWSKPQNPRFSNIAGVDMSWSEMGVGCCIHRRFTVTHFFTFSPSVFQTIYWCSLLCKTLFLQVPVNGLKWLYSEAVESQNWRGGLAGNLTSVIHILYMYISPIADCMHAYSIIN